MTDPEHNSTRQFLDATKVSRFALGIVLKVDGDAVHTSELNILDEGPTRQERPMSYFPDKSYLEPGDGFVRIEYVRDHIPSPSSGARDTISNTLLLSGVPLLPQHLQQLQQIESL